MNKPKVNESREERNVRVLALLPAIEAAVRSASRTYFQQMQDAKLDPDDIQSQLVEFAMSRTSLTPDYKVLKYVLAREIRQILMRTRTEMHSSITPGNTADHGFMDRDELRTLLSRDWENHPSFLKEALKSKHLPSQYLAAVRGKFLEGHIFPWKSAERRRLDRAIDRLLEICYQIQETYALAVYEVRPDKNHANIDYYGG